MTARLFSAGAIRAVELEPADAPRLQAFFEANPDYFLAVEGERPAHDKAEELFRDELPAGWPFTKRWFLGFEGGQTMVGMASLVSDLLAPRVWHIGLFMVAASLHGTGTAPSIYESLERWMRGAGAQWLRLGVVEGNARAERFWERAGYFEARTRTVEMGRRTNTVRVMAKALAGGTVEDYLALVARDRPDPAG